MYVVQYPLGNSLEEKQLELHKLDEPLHTDDKTPVSDFLLVVFMCVRVFKTMPCFLSEENWAKEHGWDVTIWHGEDDKIC